MTHSAIVTFLGWMASIITVIYTALGLPVQIVKNFKRKSGAGLSLTLFIFLTLTFTSWVLYGIYKPDWFIVVPNALGAICGFIVTCQIIYYGSRPYLGENIDET